jgi:hypothetical protein
MRGAERLDRPFTLNSWLYKNCTANAALFKLLKTLSQNLVELVGIAAHPMLILRKLLNPRSATMPK